VVERSPAWFRGSRVQLGSILCGAVALLYLLPRPSARAAEDDANAARPLPAWGDALKLDSPLTGRVYFASSSFEMGSDRKEMAVALADCAKEVHGQLCEASHFSNEGPVRVVTLSAFRLDRYEVSVEEYARCVRAQRCAPPPYYQDVKRFGQARFPASLITWDEARDYCHFVDAELPTEAQWERAARGTSQRRYPWGNLYNPRRSNHGRLAWDETYTQDGFAELAPVGSFVSGATPERVFDLAGNVEEWTLDRYDAEYDPQDVRDPVGPRDGTADAMRSVRGGSYTSPAVRLRGASRTAQAPDVRDPARGFRCAQAAG
jgi:formylglycine-generating enzyme